MVLLRHEERLLHRLSSMQADDLGQAVAIVVGYQWGVPGM